MKQCVNHMFQIQVQTKPCKCVLINRIQYCTLGSLFKCFNMMFNYNQFTNKHQHTMFISNFSHVCNKILTVCRPTCEIWTI